MRERSNDDHTRALFGQFPFFERGKRFIGFPAVFSFLRSSLRTCEVYSGRQISSSSCVRVREAGDLQNQL